MRANYRMQRLYVPDDIAEGRAVEPDAPQRVGAEGAEPAGRVAHRDAEGDAGVPVAAAAQQHAPGGPVLDAAARHPAGAEREVVAVQAGWRDRQDLLGHYNVLHGKYHATNFVQALYRAHTPSCSDRPFLIVLDEINLSRDEQFFADLLSALEQPPGERQLTLLGEPVSLTVNFAAGLVDGPFRIEARPVRTNRSTQHWTITLWQTAPDNSDMVMLTATAVTAVRRTTWSAVDERMPMVSPPASVPAAPFTDRVPWVSRYEMRLVAGALPQRWDDAETDSLTQLWLRDHPPRPLDYASLTALADAFFPRIWRRRARMTPIGTVSMTVYFHADANELAIIGDGYLFGQARSQSFFNGFFDQSAQLWSEAGHLLATTHQIVYYKE